jgi:hypothetical protein
MPAKPNSPQASPDPKKPDGSKGSTTNRVVLVSAAAAAAAVAVAVAVVPAVRTSAAQGPYDTRIRDRPSCPFPATSRFRRNVAPARLRRVGTEGDVTVIGRV